MSDSVPAALSFDSRSGPRDERSAGSAPPGQLGDLNLLNFLLFSYHQSWFHFTTKEVNFEGRTVRVNGGFCAG